MADNQNNQQDTQAQKEGVITEYLGLQLKGVSEQIIDETKIAEKYIRSWREQKRKYLKLYINQRKNPKKVGDTLMFSTHQTILASLYKDRLDAEWMWREEEDIDRAEDLNAVWEFDYDEMGKPQHDYDKFWDASFYGIAIEDWSHFDRDSLTPIPDLWDPLTTLFDPKAVSINGNRLGRGASRFIYREIIRTRQEMEDHGGFFNLGKLDSDEKESMQRRQTQQARDAARGLDNTFTDVKENKYYPLVQGMTWIGGKRYLVEAGNEGNTIVRLFKLPFDYFPLVDNRIYPMSHTQITPGVPDFTEDKQRARAILQNYTLDAAKLDVLPMWLFDKAKIKNKQQLRDWKAGKMIEGENLDGNSIIPLTKPAIHQFSQGIMEELETNAQKALATPEMQQGILSATKRTATEIAETSAGVNNRFGLTAALFSLSEQNAAMMWYDQYKRNFKSIDKKTVRLIGPFGPKPLPITSDSFKFKSDPDVKIESRTVSQAQKQDQLTKLFQFGQVLLQTPGASMRMFAKKAGRLMFRKSEVDALLPQTVDEMKAEAENNLLDDDKFQGSVDGMPFKVEIDPMDDHQTHLEIHGKASAPAGKIVSLGAKAATEGLIGSGIAKVQGASNQGAVGAGAIGATLPLVGAGLKAASPALAAFLHLTTGGEAGTPALQEAFNDPQGVAQAVGVLKKGGPTEVLDKIQGAVPTFRQALTQSYKDVAPGVLQAFGDNKIVLDNQAINDLSNAMPVAKKLDIGPVGSELRNALDALDAGYNIPGTTSASLKPDEAMSLYHSINDAISKGSMASGPEGVPLRDLRDQMRQALVDSTGGKGGAVDTFLKNYSNKKTALDLLESVVNAYKQGDAKAQQSALNSLRTAYSNGNEEIAKAIHAFEETTNIPVSKYAAAMQFEKVLPSSAKGGSILNLAKGLAGITGTTSPRGAGFIMRTAGRVAKTINP